MTKPRAPIPEDHGTWVWIPSRSEPVKINASFNGETWSYWGSQDGRLMETKVTTLVPIGTRPSFEPVVFPKKKRQR